MIKHIVLFKFKAETPGELRAKKIASIRKALLDLKSKVKELGYIEVGINGNKSESYDMALTCEFATWEDLQAYVVHPDHQKVSQIIRESLQERACVDYEF